MFRAGIAPDEAEDAGGLDARQGRQRCMAQFLPEQIKGFYGSLVSVSFRVRKNAQDGLGGAHLGAVAQVGADVAGGADVAVTEPDLDVLQGHAVGVQLAEEDFLRYAYAAVLASECSGLTENVLRAR